MTKSSWLKIILGTVALVVACVITWLSINVFLLTFAAILLAILLSTITSGFSKLTRIPYGLSLICVLVLGVIFFSIVFSTAAPLISEQVGKLIEEIPSSLEAFKNWAGKYVDLKILSGGKLTSEFLMNHEKLFSQATALFSFTVGTITSIVVLMMMGIYLAFSPFRYIDWFQKVFPTHMRKDVVNFLGKVGHSLRWWLLGKCVSMTIIGILTYIGLKIIGVPLAFVLGLLAALMTFIPYIGAILASVPAILLALSLSPMMALYVVLLYMLIHAIDGYLISPFVDQQTVAIPPALTIFAQILFSLLMGFAGLALASPLIVFFTLIIRELYQEKREASFSKKY